MENKKTGIKRVFIAGLLRIRVEEAVGGKNKGRLSTSKLFLCSDVTDYMQVNCASTVNVPSMPSKVQYSFLIRQKVLHKTFANPLPKSDPQLSTPFLRCSSTFPSVNILYGYAISHPLPGQVSLRRIERSTFERWEEYVFLFETLFLFYTYQGSLTQHTSYSSIHSKLNSVPFPAYLCQ